MLKTYLTTAVIILSLITSMGIFGFLSKAHLEQNLASDTLIQRIQILEDKIESEKMSIERQTLVINRAEKAISRDTGTASGDIEVQQSIIADANEKLKTLLAVETNTVRDLNDRLKVLDKNVSDVLTSNKSFFNEEKAAADLKASQKAEREQIAVKVAEAQDRIAELKRDHKQEIAKAQDIIANMRTGSQDNKGQFTKEIETAEKKIFDSQGKIDLYIVEKQPLEKEMLTLEAEIGPVKYIAALAVDWGITDQVETSKAVRWVILLLIVVFDPLAVLLLIAANQSLMRRFPVKAPKPDEVIDLEKPDEEDVTLKWNEMMAKTEEAIRKEQAEKRLKDWQDKLETFNEKVPQPEEKPVEIIQEDDGVIPHIDLVGQKKTEDEEIVPDYTDGFDPDEVMFDLPTEEEIDKQAQLEKFKQREQEEKAELERIAKEAAEEDEPKRDFQEEQAKEDELTRLSAAQSKANKEERIKPDLTEVIEPEPEVKEQEEPKDEVKNAKPLVLRTIKEETPPKPTLPDPAEMTDFDRKGLLNKFHQEHGKFEDISLQELKMERDQSNRAQYLADVSLTKEEANAQPAITESRMAFFEDMIDDILRGDTTFENVPEENRKIIAQIMDPEMPNPPIITKGSALKEQRSEGMEEMSAEGLKEKFMVQPDIEDRPMTDEELDRLLDGFDDGGQTVTGKRRMIIKDGKRIFVPVEEKADYVQNEEQSDQTLWQKTKELDIPEPDKNEIILPDLPNTTEDIPEIAESITVEQSIPQSKFETYKKRLTSGEDYHQRVEARINDLITKLDSKEIKLSDLSKEDQQVIIDILNQDG
jgi:maltodextrin utilization protein YvdJ